LALGANVQSMAFPQPSKYDIGAIVATIGLLFFAYVVYPVQLVQISTWLVIFVVYLTWMTIAAYRWTFDTDPQ
jgi:hypothetical protein